MHVGVYTVVVVDHSFSLSRFSTFVHSILFQRKKVCVGKESTPPVVIPLGKPKDEEKQPCDGRTDCCVYKICALLAIPILHYPLVLLFHYCRQ